MAHSLMFKEKKWELRGHWPVESLMNANAKVIINMTINVKYEFIVFLEVLIKLKANYKSKQASDELLYLYLMSF